MKNAWFHRCLLLCLLLTLPLAPVFACAWDSDTLETELKGLPEVLSIIVGRFERNPDLYYEMRLQRVNAEVKKTPHKLALYDDAGVAADRLKREEEAIAWMEKKRLILEELRGQIDEPEWREHRYRYLANLGTILSHRWVRGGGNRNKIGEMKRARQLIAAAIELNPEAHFGREKYQLQVMDWLIKAPKVTPGNIPTALGKKFDEGDWYEEKTAPRAIEAMSGIIVLGDAWQNVDLFFALSKAIQYADDRNTAAFMAQLRVEELIKNGHNSLLPSAPRGDKLLGLIETDMREPSSRLHHKDKLRTLYKELRTEADQWHQQRTAYMMERLKTGRHPDTDRTFWVGWVDPEAPSIAMRSQERVVFDNIMRMFLTFSAICMVLGVAIVLLWRQHRLKADRRTARVSEPG